MCVALHLLEGHSHREAKRKPKCYSGTLTETVWSRVGSWASLVLRLPNLRRPRRYQEREAQDGRGGQERPHLISSHLILPPRPAAHHGPAVPPPWRFIVCSKPPLPAPSSGERQAEAVRPPPHLIPQLFAPAPWFIFIIIIKITLSVVGFRFLLLFNYL